MHAGYLTRKALRDQGRSATLRAAGLWGATQLGKGVGKVVPAFCLPRKPADQISKQTCRPQQVSLGIRHIALAKHGCGLLRPAHGCSLIGGHRRIMVSERFQVAGGRCES